MLRHNESICTHCGLCAQTCHADSISVTADSYEIDYNTCSTCSQCIAICPTRALSWNGIPPRPVDEKLLPSAEQLEEFLKWRRSYWHFKDKKVPREKLRKIAEMGKYSPTNNYDMDVLIVDDPDLIRKIDDICIARVRRIYRIFFKPRIVRFLLKRFEQWRKADPKVIGVLENNTLFSNAPALMMVLGDPMTYLTLESSQFFLYNMQLTALSLGLGSRQSSSGVTYLAKNKKARKLLGIPKGKRIFAIMFLGYPELKYRNKVEGFHPGIRFA